jgi:hypothetical protein
MNDTICFIPAVSPVGGNGDGNAKFGLPCAQAKDAATNTAAKTLKTLIFPIMNSHFIYVV